MAEEEESEQMEHALYQDLDESEMMNHIQEECPDEELED
jgi:hypothetical protein